MPDRAGGIEIVLGPKERFLQPNLPGCDRAKGGTEHQRWAQRGPRNQWADSPLVPSQMVSACLRAAVFLSFERGERKKNKDNNK